MRRTLVLLLTAAVALALPIPATADTGADLVLAGPSYKIHRVGWGSAYRVTVTNRGPSAMEHGLLTFDLSQLDSRLTPNNAASGRTGMLCDDGGRTFQCRLPALAAGASHEYILIVEDRPGLPRGPAGNLSVVVGGGPGDPDLGNNTLRVPWQVSLGRDGRMRIDMTRASGRVGDVVTVRVAALMIGLDPQRYWGITVHDGDGLAPLGGSHCKGRDGGFDCERTEGIRTGTTQSMTLSFRILSADPWVSIGVLTDFESSLEGNWGGYCLVVVQGGGQRCSGSGQQPPGGGGAPPPRRGTAAPTPGPTPAPIPSTAVVVSATPAPTTPGGTTIAAARPGPQAGNAGVSLAVADRAAAAVAVVVLLVLAALRRRRRRPRPST